MSLIFPKDFFWGCATSAHQIEGNNTNNDWWQAEQKGTVRYQSGRACDSYNRYEEDFDLAKAMHNNAHRFSLEWSRIEPEEGKFSQEAVEHYRAVIRALKARGMEPFVTLHHFTNPVWFVKKGGWLHKDASKYFARYADYVGTHLKGDVRFWITVNEPTIYASQGFFKGKWPPHHHNPFEALAIVDALDRAHRMAVEVLHKISFDMRVGLVLNVSYVEPGGTGIIRFLNGFPAHVMNWARNDLGILEAMRDTCDFIGLNYYSSSRVFFGRILPNGKERTDFGWSIYPKGLYHSVKELSRWGKPIFITENGLADADDDQRPSFILEHLQWLYKAIQEGADVRGYFHWSLLDNFEWAEGYKMKFGLVEVNFDTLKRTPRPSARVYGEICKGNAV